MKKNPKSSPAAIRRSATIVSATITAMAATTSTAPPLPTLSTTQKISFAVELLAGQAAAQAAKTGRWKCALLRKPGEPLAVSFCGRALIIFLEKEKRVQLVKLLNWV